MLARFPLPFALLATAVATTAQEAAQGPPRPAPPVITRAAENPISLAELPPPRRFITRHETVIRGTRLRYTATAGEIYITNLAGHPIASIFSFAYVKDGPPDPSRPVLFVFNGGPGAASVWLHLGAVGPWRVILDQEVNPSNTPPFGLQHNGFSPLDVADLVFVDPVGTGFSRAIGNAVNSDFFGVDEDAESIARFIELWLTENGRWNSPKYLMGESYGATRAAILPRALVGGPFYAGVMRGITVNGVILVSPAMGVNVPAAPPNAGPDPTVGLGLPSLAATAWYHGRIARAGRSVAQVYEEAKAFGTGEYADAISRQANGTLSEAEMGRVAERLATLTGIPAQLWVANDLRVSDPVFLRTLLADQGLEAGNYDSRYTLPLAGSANDPVADDPAMGRYTPGFVAAFHDLMRSELGVNMNLPYTSINWATANFGWNWTRLPVASGRHPAEDLATAMRRTPAMRVMVASGYYDMGSPPASAENQIRRGHLPPDRVTFRNYESGHMLYLGDTAQAFADDVRAFVRAQ